MKSLTIALLFCIIYFKANAQEEYINTSSNYIRKSMEKLGFVLTNTNKTDDAAKKYISFYLSSMKIELTFYFNIDDDTCIRVLEFAPDTLLPALVKDLNKNYIKMDNSTWMSFDNKFLVKVTAPKLLKQIVIGYSLQ